MSFSEEDAEKKEPEAAVEESKQCSFSLVNSMLFSWLFSEKGDEKTVEKKAAVEEEGKENFKF